MDPVRVAIHQPNFLPWLGFFAKLAASDVFILLDDAQYTKNSYINRNKIRTKEGELWLTVPVKVNFGQAINQVRTDVSRPWPQIHIKTLRQYYGKAPGFERTLGLVEKEYSGDNEYLHSLNTSFILAIARELGIERRVRMASEFNIEAVSSERLIALVKAVGGTSYVSGKGGSSYQDEVSFRDAGLDLEYIRFDHPVYIQQGSTFIPNLSVIDYLMCRPKPESWQPRYRLCQDRSIYEDY